MLKQELKFVRLKIKRYYDKTRLEGPRLGREDKVYLISQNLRTKQPSQKLDFQKIEPFKIIDKISDNNYRLILPISIKVKTNVFYITLLEPTPLSARVSSDIEANDKEEE